jgi:poly-gamma-glutamate capsule biosynthesis protein CapA/YwtB (metallophosphatase superfamily)
MISHRILVYLAAFILLSITGQPYLALESEKCDLTLVFLGDIEMDRETGKRLRSQGAGYPFEHIKPEIEDADLTIGNLESPISDEGCPEQGKSCTFRAREETVESLVYAGIDAVTLANNHCLDYGTEALCDTMENLDNAGIRQTGLWYGEDIVNTTIKRPLIIDIQGLKIGLLAYTEDVSSQWKANKIRIGPLPLDEKLMEDDVRKCRDEVDLLIVSIHWRKWPQYTTAPEPGDRKICREILDWGADIIMGHGPHTVHEIEEYRDKLILYSIGNSAMENHNATSYYSYIVKVDLEGSEISGLTLVPIKRGTYRYVPMGTPLKRSNDMNVSYNEIMEMYRNDIYDMIEGEKGWKEWLIVMETLPSYVKSLLVILPVLVVALIIIMAKLIRGRKRRPRKTNMTIIPKR